MKLIIYGIVLLVKLMREEDSLTQSFGTKKQQQTQTDRQMEILNHRVGSLLIINIDYMLIILYLPYYIIHTPNMLNKS